jgi:hypothetical protein
MRESDDGWGVFVPSGERTGSSSFASFASSR